VQVFAEILSKCQTVSLQCWQGEGDEVEAKFEVVR
jgi:hypothetical protein